MSLLQTITGSESFPRIVAFGGMMILGLCVLSIFFFVIFRQRQNRLHLRTKAMEREFENQLMRAQLEVQDHTFSQLSQELHDNVGQLLSTTKMLMGVTGRAFAEVPEEFRTAEETLSKAIQDMRLLTKSLNDDWLHQFNLVENLQQECARIRVARQVRVTLSTNVQRLPFEPREQVMLFRVVQEALQNGIRHAKATQIGIDIVMTTGLLTIVVLDDGKGFDLPQEKSGIGIMNMKNRIGLLDGTIEWKSVVGEGTGITILLPIQPLQQASFPDRS